MFGPGNSLVLLYDHLTSDIADEMEQQIDEIGRYYRFMPFSQLVRVPKRTRKMGVAAVVFKNARKSFFLRAQKFLLEKEITPLICVRPDIQGTNRLPLTDEYRGEDRAGFSRLVWENQSAAEKELLAQREKLGPLPLNEMDPTLYLGTWGNLMEIPPQRYEVGIHVPTRSFEVKALLAEVNFIKKQLGKAPSGAFLPSTEEHVMAKLSAAGVPAAVSPREGIVDKQTSVYDIPHFVPEPLSSTV